MNIVERKLGEVRPYEKNPRRNDDAVQYVAESIRQFGFKVPIVVDADGVIVAGHTRYKAAKKLGLKTVPCIVADDLTEEQVKAFRLADNKVGEFAEWDDVLLAEELDDILNLDMAEFGFEMAELEQADNPYDIPDDEKGSLVEQFIVPPFSVLDTRAAYWQQRRKMWLERTGNLSETRNGEFGKLSGSGATLMDAINEGTSNFDPVLAELMFRWFCVDGGKVLDPFGGEQTKGVVAGSLGYEYRGCEIRQEQVDLNTAATAAYPSVAYYCGDSNNISRIIKERGFDFCFTSPPYYDLEVYSKDDMSALGTYEEFMAMYRNIFQQCYEMLKDDTFLVVKVGEIRNKKTGEYRCFVADNITMFRDIGFKFYNDIVLLNSAGTAPIRAGNSMRSRKVVKVHQNVLVFYKGRLDNIGKKFPPLDFSSLEDAYVDGGE